MFQEWKGAKPPSYAGYLKETRKHSDQLFRVFFSFSVIEMGKNHISSSPV